MALDESAEGLEKLSDNQITAYIDPDLHKAISHRGGIHIDYGTDRFGATGYSISIRGGDACKDGCCS